MSALLLKGSVRFPKQGKLIYRLLLKRSYAEEFVAAALDVVRATVREMNMGLDELEENVDHLRANVMAETCIRHSECHDMEDMASSIEFEFVRDGPLLRARIDDPPKPRQKRRVDPIEGTIQQKAERLISVANTTKELLERYAPQMEQDSELKEALTRYLESERIRQFDLGNGES